MRERILKLLEAKSISAARLADLIEINRSSMSHITSGRNKPSLDVVQKILRHFPEINSEWLILGVGEMFGNKNVSQEPNLFSNIYTTNNESDGYVQKSTNNLFPAKEPQKIITSPEKKIEKIVVFFSDKTFEEIHNK